GWRWLGSRHETSVKTIAVMPFTDALNDPQMSYLPEGVTEGIIDNLSQLPQLRVMARSTVFSYTSRYKDREVDPRQVGAILHVRAVALGRIQRQGDHLIIHVELVDPSDGAVLWSEQYQPPLTDLLAVQQAITSEISEKLRLRLSGEQQRQLAKRH